jgi:hypothetical protein
VPEVTTERTTEPTAAPLGDAVPPVLAAYYGAIDGDRFADAAATFAGDGLYAVPLPGEAETAPRAETVGPAALLERFTERGPKPWRHVVRLCVVEGPDAIVEGVLVDDAGDEISTFVGAARIADDGLLERYLAFSCAGARDPIPTDVSTDVVPADAATVVHDYFVDLDAGRFEAAAAHFSDDVLYSHPPYKHTGIDDPNRIEFRSRPALEAAFRARGKASFGHDVVTSIQRGPHCIFEGAVHGVPGGFGSFISSLSLAADGTISRYVSFYCEPGVRAR